MLLYLHAVVGEDEFYEPLTWFIGERYIDAYKDWSEALKVAQALGIVEGTPSIRDNGQLVCTFFTKWGQKVQTVSGHDAQTIGREEPEIIVGAEASLWSEELWQRVFGRLERRSRFGSRMLASGSFESAIGPFYTYYNMGRGANEEDLVSFKMPSWSNLALYPEGYDDPAMRRQRALNSKQRFMERFGAEPAPPALAVLPQFNSAIHIDGQLKYEKGAPTYCFVDPGDHVYGTMIVQVIGGEVRVLESIYAHMSHHEAVITDTQNLEGWKYTSNTRRVVIDVQAKARHAQSESPIEIWRRRTGYTVTGRKVAVDASVERLRSLLEINPATGLARLRIHPRNTGLIAEMGGGKSPVPGGGPWLKTAVNGSPRRENDHLCKALAYGIIELYGTQMPEEDYRDYDTYDQTEAISYVGNHFA